jgi:hypothetical protein
VKELLESREGVPSALQRLAFAGRELGGRTLADCGVGADATLHLSVPLDGGAKKRKREADASDKAIVVNNRIRIILWGIFSVL